MGFERGPAARLPERGGRSDRLAAVLLFFVSALYVRYALTFQPPRFRSEVLGPATFPLMIGTLMLVCSTLLFIQSLRAARTPAAPPAVYVPALSLWAALLGYVLLFDGLGFPLSTGLFLLTGLWLLGVRPWWKTILYAAVFTAALYAAFTALDVRLPGGEWLRR